MGLRFLKMHGLGNDFVVLDGRTAPLAIDATQARAIADRKTGVGCDQLILIEPPRDPQADVVMRIYNADGGEVEVAARSRRAATPRAASRAS
jgi:diaminopimelate epimerase